MRTEPSSLRGPVSRSAFWMPSTIEVLLPVLAQIAVLIAGATSAFFMPFFLDPAATGIGDAKPAGKGSRRYSDDAVQGR
ncbi:hypothetical protein [Burkholderia sp. BCC1972]|uniref:hypothetical protein n=1 Tax=Burkholderia sp. BCC1972 TaxID=2817438 RepID=UPI002ABD26A4|nr:hypothetical protein [Burkholderia sp. BCC1972]